MVNRQISSQILARLKDKKAIILLGARQTGKSTLLQLIKENFNAPVAYWNADEIDIRSQLENPTSTRLRALIGYNRTIVIDEAQRIENIGLCIKLITDNINDVKVIATGSSAFELSNKINEPLTGRKWEFQIYPLSFSEMVDHTSLIEEKRLLQHRMIYGYYPEVVTSIGNEEAILKQLANSYLYKDILTWERIQKPDRLEKLLQALAFQVGQLVNNHELGQLCGLNAETVNRYINLLEKAFIIFRLPSYNRNLRNELKKSQKVYFYDNGIRNAVINQFNPINLRNDIGQLWENWFINERIKFLNNIGKSVNKYFWRTLEQQEVDYVEEYNNKIIAFECKWNPKGRIQITKTFKNSYPNAISHFINYDNFEQFILNYEDQV